MYLYIQPVLTDCVDVQSRRYYVYTCDSKSDIVFSFTVVKLELYELYYHLELHELLTSSTKSKKSVTMIPTLSGLQTRILTDEV